MADPVVGAAVQVLLENLISVSGEQINLVRDFNEHLKKFNESVIMIHHVLDDAEKKQVADKSVRLWLKKLEAVAFEADNVLDELSYQLLRKKVKKQIKKEKKVSSSFSFYFGYKMARKIKDINTKLKSINEEAKSYDLQTTLASAPSHLMPHQGAETDSFNADPVFFGRENDVLTIVEILTACSDERVFSILPIVGMGGLGKTTVARKVYADEKLKKRFQKHIWVHVSQHFDANTLFKKILTSLTADATELGNREALLKKLQEKLEGQRYLVVLDDVWNDDSYKWDDFVNSLSGISPKKGNVIIVTTRKDDVASLVNTLPPYELKTLSEDNCWSIIKAKAFREGDIPSSFETIGRTIAERCRGLPLAAKVVGGMLRGRPFEEWISIEKNLISHFRDENTHVLEILKLSFHHLSPPSLKKCFAYCSVFPKGYLLEREQLIDLWMAEGFLQTDRENNMEIVGDQYFNRLLRSSLLQIGDTDNYGNITNCSMHDLVHDLADSILSPTMSGNNLDSINQVRYIGLQSINGESLPVREEQWMFFRTLFYNAEVSDILISNLKSLHVLVLRCDAEELPSSIKELLHLRCLDISYTKIKYLPDSIGELHHLQTLRAVKVNIWEVDYLEKLPNTLKYLISLRHLHIPPIELPLEIGQLASLQTLKYFLVGNEKGRGIVELGSLKNLKGKLKIQNLENVHDKEEAKGACLNQKPGIIELRLFWNENRTNEVNDENVLEAIQPHPNLKSLEIYGFKSRRFPLWTLRMAVQDDLEGQWVGLTNLMHLTLYRCSECEEVPMLGHLPHLKSLYLCSLTSVRSIGSSFYGIDNCHTSVRSSNNGVQQGTIIHVFPSLEMLELNRMPNLTEWVGVELAREAQTQQCEVVVFPRLRCLMIHRCSQLMSAPTHFPCLEELEISEMEGLVSLPIGLFCNNKDLPLLTVQDGGQSQGLSSLRDLAIWDCKGLTSLRAEMLDSCAPTLEALTLTGLSSLTNLPLLLGCLQKMSRLESLEIIDVPKLFDSSEVEITGSLPSLRKLHIGYLRFRDSTVDSFKSSSLDGFLQGVQYSLCELKLYGMEHWDSLPDQLRHLTALSTLHLNGFGIEALPEWFGNLSSLERLDLWRCKKLRSLPSKEAMQRLTELTSIFINYCPLLGEQIRNDEQQSDGGSEFSKISHNRTIFVDGRLIQRH